MAPIQLREVNLQHNLVTRMKHDEDLHYNNECEYQAHSTPQNLHHELGEIFWKQNQIANVPTDRLEYEAGNND